MALAVIDTGLGKIFVDMDLYMDLTILEREVQSQSMFVHHLKIPVIFCQEGSKRGWRLR